MATRFLTNLDLVQNQIVNGRFEVLASDPSSGNFDGRLIYNSTEKVLKWYDSTASEWRKVIKSVAINANTPALTSSESNGAVTLAIADATTSESGLFSNEDKTKLDASTSSNTNSTLVLRDGSGRFQATAPSADLDVANKAYVDAARSGLDVKASVRLATATHLDAFTHSAGVLTADADGALTIDGVTPSAADRILVKDETSSNAPYNGIYVVTTVGDGSTAWVLTRATDADSSAEVTAGMFTFVAEGSVNADSGWVLTTNDTITLGTTGLSFAQFSGAGSIVAGAGLTKTGNTVDVVGTADRITVNANDVDIASTYVGQSSITTLGTITSGTWNATDIAIADGGTGASTASDARTNLADTASGGDTSTPVLARVAAKTVGNNSDTVFTVTHNFGTRDVIVQVYDASTYDTVIADTVRSSTNAVTVTFAAAPATNAYRVVVTG
jgi:hypothetical protein